MKPDTRTRRATTRTSLATTEEVAGYLRKPAKTLANWRSMGMGPRYRLVGRDVRYDWADVDAWLKDQASGPGNDRPAA
jgi:hypothetical protein